MSRGQKNKGALTGLSRGSAPNYFSWGAMQDRNVRERRRGRQERAADDRGDALLRVLSGRRRMSLCQARLVGARREEGGDGCS